jgi:predicted CXXCH cytochrome family protein
MKALRIALLLTFLFLVICTAVGRSKDSSLQIIYPASQRIITDSDRHYIMGIADSSEIESIEISRTVEKSAILQVDAEKVGSEFASMVREQFGANFYISWFEYKAEYSTNLNRNKTIEAEFSINDNIDLQQFWRSKQFKKIYAQAVKDTNAVKISIVIQGKSLMYADKHKRNTGDEENFFFISRLQLNPGSNDVLLVGLDAKGEVVEEIPITYVFKSKIDSKTEAPVGFENAVFHGSEQQAICSECHEMDFYSMRNDVERLMDECYRCHTWVTEDRHIHGPASTWDCMYCHDVTGNVSENMLRPYDSPSSMCYECHDTFRDHILSDSIVHGPVGLGECTLCHSPHGSNNLGQVWMPVVQLCTTCHGDKYYKDHPVVGHPIMGDENPSDPGQNLSCVSCHNPHSGNNENLFYSATGVFELCQECHNK